MQNPRCILKFYSMRLYLYKQPHLMRTWRLTSSSILFRYVVWSHYWRHSSTAMEGSKGCIVDSGTPLPSNLPHHDLALHSWSAKADCFEDFLARDEAQRKPALSHVIYFSSPKTQNSTRWAAVLYKSLEIACASQMGTTNTIKRI